MKTGDLIKKYRKMRGMTQKQLAAECGQTDSAIRNYELGNRTPGDERLRAIAAALAISSESLREVPLESSREALELLFRIADEFGLEPMEVDGMFVLGFDTKTKKAPELDAALRAWKTKCGKVESGELTAEDFELWKLEFGA
ncbi:helix-turn-helix transcriptional regulator [Slackia exigua]|uniref:helix-turn-helix transcriptional regulator n=1 Tax=Slackia exigua TaxID=84109 RepID=UPI00210CDB16|nr:helix-turn-helix transcriptional regulator [Slackia exigua]MCQ5091244.1 helix-turn-helix domain-containing protein [Slackia exigua]